MGGGFGLGDALGRYGLLAATGRTHLWIHGGDLAAFEHARPLLLALAHHEPRYRLLLTGEGSAADRRRIGHRFPGATVRPVPARLEYAARRFLVAHKVHGLVALDGASDLGPQVFALARWLRIPVVRVTDRPGLPPRMPEEALAHVVVRDAGRMVDLVAAGLSPARATLAAEAEAAALAISRALREWKDVGRRGAPTGLARGSRWLLSTALGRAALAARPERLADLCALRRALPPLDTLVCLGNGPSSEDPRLGALAPAAVFRINWTWRGRGGLARPDVVFLGDPAYPRGVGRPILAFRTIDHELSVLRRRVLAPRPWRVRYFTMERFGLSILRPPSGPRPTNGAAMITVAAALGPARLVVAGVDLYAHPAGAYLDDAATANAYPVMHDRETDPTWPPSGPPSPASGARS